MKNDQELLESAQQLDQSALAEVYDRYHLELYRYAYRLLGSSDHAEECLSETFLRMLRALHQGKGPKKQLRAYLYRIAHNWIMDFFRRRPPPMMPLDLEQVEQLPAQGKSPAQSAEEAAMAAQVRALLHELTPDQQQVIVLKFLEGWENGEISAALEKSPGAVKALQARALASLADKLSNHNYSGGAA